MNARIQMKGYQNSASASAVAGLLHRKCACGGGAAGLSGDCDPCAQQRLQRKASGITKSDAIPPIVNEVLRSSGAPLDAGTRGFMEPRFGHDFSQVRVHTDVRAVESAQAVSAQAYTVGRNVVFGANAYAPATHRGRELLAHELAHTIQQRNAIGTPSSVDSNGILESSAEAAGRAVADGGVVSRDIPSSGVGLSRTPDEEREAAAKEALEYLARAQAEEKDEEEKDRHEAAASRPTMNISKGSAAKPVAKPTSQSAMRRDTTSSKFTPGGFTDAHINHIVNQADEEQQKEIAELDQQDREITKRSFASRLAEARRLELYFGWGVRNATRHDKARLTAEGVWLRGFNNGLFIEREKKFVYEEQGASQEYHRQKVEQAAEQARKDFEIKQYREHVARGEQLSSPAPFIQPFAYGALGWVAGAAYAGSQTGLTVGEIYNACANGTGADCAAATAKGVATTAAVKVATRGKPGADTTRATNVTRRNAADPPYAPANPLADTQPGFAFDKTKPGAPLPPGNVTQNSIPPSGGGGGGGGGGGRRSRTLPGNPPPMPGRPPPPRPVISWFPRRDATPMSPDDVMRVYQTDHTRIILSYNKGNNMAEWTAVGGRGLPPLAFTSGKNVRVDAERWLRMGYQALRPPR